jgi:hypothetical protein
MMTETWEARSDSSKTRVKIYRNNRFVLAYNTGGPIGDFYRPRPDFYPVYSPEGYLLTDQHTYRHIHHASLWLGHGRVGHRVNNFFHNTPHDGRIITRKIAWSSGEDAFRMGSELEWVNVKGGVDLKELRLFELSTEGRTHILDWHTRLVPADQPVVMLRDNHSFICFRVADTMDVEDGGHILNADGQVNEEGCMMRPTAWIDYSGPVAGHSCGITLMNHPDNAPSNWFVRNYGTVCLSPFNEADVPLSPDTPFEYRVRFLLHDDGPEDMDIDNLYRAFVQRAVQDNPLETGGATDPELRF